MSQARRDPDDPNFGCSSDADEPGPQCSLAAVVFMLAIGLVMMSGLCSLAWVIWRAL